MKKFIFLISIILMVSAHAAEYSDLMKKAKQAEESKEWTYAMGYYLDALETDAKDKTEAFDRLAIIGNSIRSGNPGLRPDGSSWSPFELCEDWQNLLVNTEKYFTEYCPYNFKVGKPEMIKADLASKTAEYRVRIIPENSFKFDFLMNTVYKGFYKVKNGNAGMPSLPGVGRTWAGTENFLDSGSAEREITSGKPETLSPVKYDYGWPVVSASKIPGAEKKSFKTKYFEWKDYPLVKDNSLFYKNGVAVYSIPREMSDANGIHELSTIEYFNPWFIYTSNENTIVPRIMYDLKVRLVDENGNVIAKSRRFMPAAEIKTISFDNMGEKYNSYAFLNFPGITQAQMKLLDSGKAWLDIEAVYLEYGFQNYGDLKDYSSSWKTIQNDVFDFKKNLPELQIPLGKCVITNELTGTKDLLKEKYHDAALKAFVKNTYYGKESVSIKSNNEIITIKIGEKDKKAIPFGVDFSEEEIEKALDDLYGLKNAFDAHSINGTYCYVAKFPLSPEEAANLLYESKTKVEAFLSENEKTILASYECLKFDDSKAEYEDARTAVAAISTMHKGLENKDADYLMLGLSEVAGIDVKAMKDAASEIEIRCVEVKKVYDSYYPRYENALKYLGEYNRNVVKEEDLLYSIKTGLDDRYLENAEIACEKIKAQEKLFAETDEEVKKAKDAVDGANSLYEEKAAILEDVKLLFNNRFDNSTVRSQFNKLQIAVENLKSAMDESDNSEITECCQKLKATDISALEEALNGKKAEAAESNRKLSEEIRKDVRNKKAVLDSVKAYVSGTAEASFNEINSRIDAYEKSFASSSDAEIVSKKSEIESMNFDEKVFAFQETAAFSILKEYGLTLTKCSNASIDVFNYSVFNTEDDCDLYSLEVAKKSIAEKAKLKKTDYLFFAKCDDAKKIVLKNSSEKVPEWKDFVKAVIDSKDSGKLNVVYFRKSMGSFDGYCVELNLE